MMDQIDASIAPPPELQDTQLPPLDPTAQGGLMQEQMGQLPQPGQQPPGGMPGEKPELEVHFVYAEWCGHSQKAIPAFKELVDDSSVVTSDGINVKFVMTEESDPGMEQFKGKVQGFPTFIVVAKHNGSIMGMRELNVPNRTAESVRAAAQNIKLNE